MSGPPSTLLEAQLPRPGDTIAGKYVLEAEIGKGGMGAVYSARHLKLSKPVAIKIMLADKTNPEASARFINEGRAAANIQNDHVVRVDDVDEEMGYAYMVLELLEGEDLAKVLEREPLHRLPPHVAVGYVLQALRGIAQAHAIGIVHRDLKPSNLFLARRQDGSIVVKVLDFGISKAQGSSALAASPNALTSTKAMLGSPLYMSPEQLRSSKTVDQRADIWGIGVILYELLSGALPFMGETLGELFAAILETDAMSLQQRVEGIPPTLEAVVFRCLARRPDQRYQSIAELSQALAPFAMAVPMQTAALGQHAARGSSPMLAAAPAGGVAPYHRAPAPGAVTPSGPMSGRGGTVAYGAVTPQGGMQQSGSGWQSTGGAGITVPKSKAPVIIGAIAGCVMLLVVGGGVTMLLRSKATHVSAGASAAIDPPPPSTPVVAPSAVASAAPVPAAPASTPSAEVPAPSVSAAAGAVATTPQKPVHVAQAKPSPAPLAAPRAPAVDPTPKTKPATPPPPPPTNGAGNIQNSR